VSIFVNPMQFNNPNDLNSYPIDEEGDLAKIRSVDENAVVFYPPADAIYPPGYSTKVEVEELTNYLCGPTRPGHFTGVATVVAKLFNIVEPDVALFGEKDYQQLAVIRRMTKDLNFSVEIIGVPTYREPDGLAMSSRNARLTDDERTRAVVLSQALFKARNLVAAGEHDAAKLIKMVRDSTDTVPHNGIDYVEIVNANTLQVSTNLSEPAVMALAVQFGASRLIDNVTLVAP